MSANVDKVLAAIDVGLQSSDEHGYPPRIDHPELCARCLAAHHVEDGDLCAPCRAWMLGDSDADPARGEDERDSFIHTLIDSLSRPVECERVNFETHPQPRSHGCVVHHINGNARDNRPENLRIVPAREYVAHVHEYDATLQCACGVMDIGVVPPNRWTIDYTYVGEGRRVVHYSADGRHGQYVTDDERPFEVRMYSRDGLSLRAELVNADDIVCHWVTDTGVEWVRNRHEPAAFRVEDEFTTPAHRWLVACRRCGARYSVDQQRRDEGLAIMRRDGHGEGGLCMLGVALQDSEEEDDRISATVDLPAPWQVELFEHLRRVVAGARERLGL